MINRLIELSLRNRFIVIALFIGLAGWGWWAVKATPIDAIPDLSDNQVIVFTDWQGHSPQEVEDQITYPLTVSLQGLAGVRVVRSQSAFGFSMIYAVFEDNVDLYFARARVLERMSLVAKTLPAGVVPTLGPDATGVGHVFWYTLESPTLSLRELRTPAGLVRSLPAQCRPGRGRSRVRRRLRPAVPDRRRPEPPSPVRAAAQRGRVGRAREQSQCRRQRPRVERRLADRARCRADRLGRRRQEDRDRRLEWHAGVRRAGRERADRQRVPRRVAGQRRERSRRRRRRRAHGREYQGRHRRGEGAHRTDSAWTARRASRSSRSTTAQL